MNYSSKNKISALFFIMLSACASGTEKKIDARIAAEPEVSHASELNAKAKALIDKNPKFTPEQKQKLSVLHHDVHEHLNQLHEESLKIRALLIDEMIEEHYNAAEVKVLKSKLKHNYDERLKIYFSAVEKTKAILGIKTERQERQELMRQMILSRDNY